MTDTGVYSETFAFGVPQRAFGEGVKGFEFKEKLKFSKMRGKIPEKDSEGKQSPNLFQIDSANWSIPRRK